MIVRLFAVGCKRLTIAHKNFNIYSSVSTSRNKRGGQMLAKLGTLKLSALAALARLTGCELAAFYDEKKESHLMLVVYIMSRREPLATFLFPGELLNGQGRAPSAPRFMEVEELPEKAVFEGSFTHALLKLKLAELRLYRYILLSWV